MKKVIVTRENYEEVMFDLLENNYPKEVRENILDQVHADTFLNFEWQQWSKATYSESTEVYKNTEAEFIENLTKEEEKKKGLLYYIIPMAVAASILLFMGVYFLYNRNTAETPGMVRSPAADKVEEKAKTPDQQLPEAPLENEPEKEMATKITRPENPELPPPIDEHQESPMIEKQDTVLFVEKQEIKQPAPTSMDTIRTMIAAAKKQPRYKITIVEGQADVVREYDPAFVEKRYSMADVLNRKDGISLSKFLQNPNSRIVTDKTTNKVTIEYVAEDHSVLVLTLSN